MQYLNGLQINNSMHVCTENMGILKVERLYPKRGIHVLATIVYGVYRPIEYTVQFILNFSSQHNSASLF